LLCRRGAAIGGHLQEGAKPLLGLVVSHSITFYRYRTGAYPCNKALSGFTIS
jgi:hypothetical protein